MENYKSRYITHCFQEKTTIMSLCSNLNDSMEFRVNDLVVAEEDLFEGSMSFGDLMHTSSGSSTVFIIEDLSPRAAPTGVVGGIVHLLKNLIQKQDDNTTLNPSEVQPRAIDLMGESGQNSSMQFSAAHQSSSTHVAGGFFMPPTSIQK